jgi:Na+-transporting NADH:ubiquinone oxidoreductase subunit B
VFQKQIMMRRVIYSLIPIFLFSIYLYGWRVISITAVVFSAGILTEYLFMKQRKQKVSEAVFVSCALYSLSMPPMVPLWIAIIGIIFAILFGKCIYGGFGRNVFNPAITGRLFIYITFPTVMTGGWMIPGRFGTLAAESVTGATPLEMMRIGNIPPLMDLLSGFRMGALGESAIILIVIAAVYLIFTKTASWKSMLSTVLSFLVLQAALYYSGIIYAPPLESLLSGSILFIAVFMVTDPISSAKKPLGQVFYGIVIGVSLALIRDFSLFPEGSSFAILMGNMFAPLLDEFAAKFKKKAVKK